MRLGGRLAGAIEVLEDIEKRLRVGKKEQIAIHIGDDVVALREVKDIANQSRRASEVIFDRTTGRFATSQRRVRSLQFAYVDKSNAGLRKLG